MNRVTPCLTVEPLRNLLLVPLHPLDVGFGSLQGLFYSKCGRAETCCSVLLHEPFQLAKGNVWKQLGKQLDDFNLTGNELLNTNLL